MKTAHVRKRNVNVSAVVIYAGNVMPKKELCPIANEKRDYYTVKDEKPHTY